MRQEPQQHISNTISQSKEIVFCDIEGAQITMQTDTNECTW